MQRVAFLLHIREGQVEAYDEAHRHVWPELIREMEQAGVREYSIFRRDRQLFLYLHVEDRVSTMARLHAGTWNKKWQAAMSSILEPSPDLQPGEEFAMLEEVFYMPGTGQHRQEPRA